MSCRHARDRHLWLLAATAALLVELTGCGGGRASRRPSILLFVLDTTRVDAVSAYGYVASTTPTVDALAASGLRYTRAYAQAPWTLPSHATLFTGLLPSQHGVGWQGVRAADELTMLAERLRDAGYETMGVSENAWISDSFNMVQGFDRFTATDVREHYQPDVVKAVTTWARERRGQRPFFLFVNVVDPHAPYIVRTTNAFLAPGVTGEQAAGVSQKPKDYFCARSPRTRDLAILWSLYLGDVVAADAKLRSVLAALREAGLARDLLTIVTADHGEHFGEHGLFSHQFTVREQVLHVPLVVHGLPGVAPAVIDTPVPLADVVPSVLGWSGLPVPGDLAGRALPTDGPSPGETSAVVAEFIDIGAGGTRSGGPVADFLRLMAANMRRGCKPDDRVFGDMRAVVRYPFKLVWYARYPAQLYDLAADGREEHDLATARPALVTELTAELDRLVARHPQGAPSATGPSEPEAVSPDVLERLRALGYVGDGGARSSEPRGTR